MTIYRDCGKRVVDILMAGFGILMLWPILTVAAMAIRFSMGSPVLFCQQRVGANGRMFNLIKFRTMLLNSERHGTVTIKDDRRLTPVGVQLRRFKIDELPQLLNVLKGDMSIVGPRPDVPGFADKLIDEDSVVLSVKPGLTGPASVIFAKEETLLARKLDPVSYNRDVIFRRKVSINKAYISNISVCVDWYWIWRTACIVWPRQTLGSRSQPELELSNGKCTSVVSIGR